MAFCQPVDKQLKKYKNIFSSFKSLRILRRIHSYLKWHTGALENTPEEGCQNSIIHGNSVYSLFRFFSKTMQV